MTLVICVKCRHEWDAKAWQSGTRNIQCPKCGGWNQVPGHE